MANIRRASTRINTYTVDEKLYDRVVENPENTFTAVNVHGRSHNMKCQEFVQEYAGGTVSVADNGHLIKIIKFPWHP